MLLEFTTCKSAFLLFSFKSSYAVNARNLFNAKVALFRDVGSSRLFEVVGFEHSHVIHVGLTKKSVLEKAGKADSSFISLTIREATERRIS